MRSSASFVARGQAVKYVDIVPLMLDADGKPDPALFIKDGLHLSTRGYELWTAAINKALKSAITAPPPTR